jgi:hypothetical protein
VGKTGKLDGAPKTGPQPETPQSQECLRNCSASVARETRRFTGFLRSSHRLPSQLHRTIGARREKPVLERTLHLGEKLRDAAIGNSENDGEAVGFALTMHRFPLRALPRSLFLAAQRPLEHPWKLNWKPFGRVRAASARVLPSKRLNRSGFVLASEYPLNLNQLVDDENPSQRVL